MYFIFPFSWEFHHPNWRSYIFQRGRYTTNQICFNHLLWIFDDIIPSPFRIAQNSMIPVIWDENSPAKPWKTVNGGWDYVHKTNGLHTHSLKLYPLWTSCEPRVISCYIPINPYAFPLCNLNPFARDRLSTNLDETSHIHRY